jgi:hypothetical protein
MNVKPGISVDVGTGFRVGVLSYGIDRESAGFDSALVKHAGI